VVEKNRRQQKCGLFGGEISNFFTYANKLKTTATRDPIAPSKKVDKTENEEYGTSDKGLGYKYVWHFLRLR
jgi:hypothetical protein